MSFLDELNSIAKNDKDRIEEKKKMIEASIEKDVSEIKRILKFEVEKNTYNSPIGTRRVRCEYALRNSNYYSVDYKRSFWGEKRTYYLSSDNIENLQNLQSALSKESITSKVGFRSTYEPTKKKIFPVDLSASHSPMEAYPSGNLNAGDLIEWEYYLLCEIVF